MAIKETVKTSDSNKDKEVLSSEEIEPRKSQQRQREVNERLARAIYKTAIYFEPDYQPPSEYL